MQEATWTSSSEAHVLARELGERIKCHRTDVGMEISELAARTKIAARLIKSLEEGSLVDLPGPVFVKGFIRSVCSELKRDPLPLLDLVDQINAVQEPAEEPDIANGSRKIVPLVLSGILLAGLVIGAILLLGGGETREDKTVGAQQSLPVQDASDVAPEEAIQEETAVELDLLIRATEKTWLRIQADASDPWETTMRTGDEIRLKAVERVELFIGNAGGVLFELNGKKFGPLGTQGQVISSYVITKDNL